MTMPPALAYLESLIWMFLCFFLVMLPCVIITASDWMRCCSVRESSLDDCVVFLDLDAEAGVHVVKEVIVLVHWFKQ